MGRYDALIQSVFYEMFGDLEGEKGPLSRMVDLNPSKRELSHLPLDVEVSFVPMSNVLENGQMILEQERKISDVNTGFTYFREGDVLFAKITPCMENGKGAIAKGLTNGFGFGSTEFHVLGTKEGCLPEFVFHLTKTQKFRKEAEKNMTGSAGQKRVPTNFLNNYPIVQPPLELQQRFAEVVQEIEGMKAEAVAGLSRSEELMGSLMAKVFGK